MVTLLMINGIANVCTCLVEMVAEEIRYQVELEERLKTIESNNEIRAERIRQILNQNKEFEAI